MDPLLAAALRAAKSDHARHIDPFCGNGVVLGVFGFIADCLDSRLVEGDRDVSSTEAISATDGLLNFTLNIKYIHMDNSSKRNKLQKNISHSRLCGQTLGFMGISHFIGKAKTDSVTRAECLLTTLGFSAWETASF